MSALVSAYSVPRTMPGIQTKVGIPFLYMDSFNPHHDDNIIIYACSNNMAFIMTK